jgi:hypothetical protein
LIFLFLFAVEELYGTRYQSGSFSLINVGSGFHCLRSFIFLLEKCAAIPGKINAFVKPNCVKPVAYPPAKDGK